MTMQSSARSSGWLALTLSPEFLIASLSSQAEQLTGYSPQELVGRPITQVLADSSSFEILHILDRTKERGHWEGEIAHRSRDGRVFKARSSLSLLEDKGNRAAGYLLTSIVNNNSTTVARDDSALAEVASNLRSLAHDLNNPLAVMMGFTQLLVLNGSCQGRIRTDAELKRVILVVERLHEYALSLYGEQTSNEGTNANARSA
jgi:PAS domain S-box-containing protein